MVAPDRLAPHPEVAARHLQGSSRRGEGRGASQLPCDFDVLVIGGGMVGASFVCALAHTGLRLGMVEAVPFAAAEQPSYDERTTALSWGTRQLFEGLDVWQALAADAAPIRHLHVSECGRFGVTRVNHADYDVDALGYVLPNRVLGRALYTRLDNIENLQIIAPARFTGLVTHDDCITVTIEAADKQERTLRTRLLVGADGARSRVRDALKLSAQVRDYEQKAVVTTITSGRAHADTAYERFTADGPLAILPRGDARYAVVWALPSATADAYCELAADKFLELLQARFGYRLGELSVVGERLRYPLLRLVCANPTAARAVLVGNAGHNLHPAAAQGFNLAMRDVSLLAQLLAEAAQAGADPGDPELIRRWYEARRADQRRVSDFTDRIVRVFSNHVPMLGVARSFGLLGLELLPTVKHDMARRSMGLAMDLSAPPAPKTVRS